MGWLRSGMNNVSNVVTRHIYVIMGLIVHVDICRELLFSIRCFNHSETEIHSHKANVQIF